MTREDVLLRTQAKRRPAAGWDSPPYLTSRPGGRRFDKGARLPTMPAP